MYICYLQSKCEPYYPDDYKSSLLFGDISVSAKLEKEASHYIIRKLTLTKVNWIKIIYISA